MGSGATLETATVTQAGQVWKRVQLAAVSDALTRLERMAKAGK